RPITNRVTVSLNGGSTAQPSSWALDRQRVERHRQPRVLVEGSTRLNAGLGDRGRAAQPPVQRLHRAQCEFTPGPDRPELGVLEDLAHRVHAEDAAAIGDQRRDLRRFVGIVLFLLGVEEMLVLENRMQLAEGLEDRGLAAEIELLVLRKQAFEHELMRRADAQSHVPYAVAYDIVVDAVELGR